MTKRVKVTIIVLLASMAVLLSNYPRVIAQSSTPEVQVKIQLLATNVIIRSGPGDSYPELAKVSAPGKIILSGISADGNWFMFRYGNGQGWIPSDPKISKFLLGNKGQLPVITDQVSEVVETLTPNTPFQRSSLAALRGKDYCGSSESLDALSELQIALTRVSNQSSNEEIVSSIEKSRTTFFESSQLVECLLDQGEVSKGLFQISASAANMSSTFLIGNLLLPREVAFAKSYLAESQNFDAGYKTLLNAYKDTIVLQGFAIICKNNPTAPVFDGIKNVYSRLDKEVSELLDKQQYSAAFSTIDQIRTQWLKVADAANCSSTIMKLTFLTTYILDESLIATLYINRGDKDMFTFHAQAAIRATRYANGLINPN